MVGKVNIGLETDHRGLNKFVSREEQNYQTVLGQIKHVLSKSAPTPSLVTMPSIGMPYALTVEESSTRSCFGAS